MKEETKNRVMGVVGHWKGAAEQDGTKNLAEGAGYNNKVKIEMADVSGNFKRPGDIKEFRENGGIEKTRVCYSCKKEHAMGGKGRGEKTKEG